MKKRRWEKKAWRRRTEQKPGEKGHKTRRWCVNPRRVKMQTGRRAPTRRELTNIRTINSALIPNPRGNFCEASFFFYALTSFSTKTFCLWTPGGAFEHNRCVPVCVCVCVWALSVLTSPCRREHHEPRCGKYIIVIMQDSYLDEKWQIPLWGFCRSNAQKRKKKKPEAGRPGHNLSNNNNRLSPCFSVFQVLLYLKHLCDLFLQWTSREKKII